MGCGNSNTRSAGWCLPQKCTDLTTRAAEIADRRSVYQWFYDIPHVPPFPREVPKYEKNVGTHLHRSSFFADVYGLSAKLKMNSVLNWIEHIGVSEDPFEFYDKVFEGADIQPPKVKATWRQDDEFAWQRMNGCNPTLMRRLNAIPAKLPLTDDTVRGLLPEGYTIERLLADGRLFVCDYEEIDCILAKCPPDRCMTAPIAVLWSDPRTNKLMPLAIQLGQRPGPDFPIFTPLDPKGCWTVAKMHCQVADACLHEVSAHLMATHIMMEAVYMAMNRNMSPSHPVFAWLHQNFWYTININWAARTKLIGPDGAVPTVMALGYEGTVALLVQTSKKWKIQRYDIPLSMSRREITDKAVLPEWYWRDDALVVWGAIERFVTAMVNTIYASDAEVFQDRELQLMFKDLTDERGFDGCGFDKEGLHVDSNSQMATKADLAKFFTGVVFNVSAGHSAVNNGQYDYMGYVPNSPFTFRMPPPKTKADISDRDIAKALPDGAMTRLGISFVHMLSLATDDKLGSYDGEFFLQPSVKANVDAFNAELKSISASIKARNATLPRPYTYLDPDQLSQGIAV